MYNCLKFLGILLGLMIQIDNGFHYCCFNFLDGEPIFGGVYLWEFYVLPSWDQSLSWFLSLTIYTYRGADKSDLRLKALAPAPCRGNLPYWPLEQANGIFQVLLSLRYTALGGGGGSGERGSFCFWNIRFWILQLLLRRLILWPLVSANLRL